MVIPPTVTGFLPSPDAAETSDAGDDEEDEYPEDDEGEMDLDDLPDVHDDAEGDARDSFSPPKLALPQSPRVQQRRAFSPDAAAEAAVDVQETKKVRTSEENPQRDPLSPSAAITGIFGT
jgi:hypothetical protein